MSLYTSFINAFVTAHSKLTKKTAYSEGQKRWLELKVGGKENKQVVEKEIAILNKGGKYR